MALTSTTLPGLTLLSQGKVRDIYSTSNPDALLFVATDRISAYDVVMKNGIPDKGRLLTAISLFWFDKLKDVVPNHLITADVDAMPDEVKAHRDVLDGRTMLVKKAKVIPIEAIVRGYITGSAWAEYKKSGTAHGISLPAGLVESDKLAEPLFTPSTKADQGNHDENIHPDKAAELIGKELFDQISHVSLALYKRASEYALSRGLILADTKFEFGLASPASGGPPVLTLIDEVLTPDSSRYWPLAGYRPGKPQPSFDKQYLRDWLTAVGFEKGLEKGKDGEDGWTVDDSVVEGTKVRYEEAYERLAGSLGDPEVIMSPMVE